ncbi:MAG: isopenicillin N synthase-like dioxygenase [Planctomycetota bacterium]|jgi:isopenicillin N synthase-like dioxygenase
MSDRDRKQSKGVHASSSAYAQYDQVQKAEYQLAESADRADSIDEEFRFETCDLRLCLHGDDRDQQRFADQLGSAMEEIGFVILEGHGIDTELFDDAEHALRDLFNRSSLQQKLRYRAARHGAVSEGYFPIRETSDIHPDLVEGWVFGRRAFNIDQDAGYDAHAFWPQPELEPRLRPLIEQELMLFQPIMRSVLRYLGCDPALFDERLAQPNFGQRLNWYPPLQTEDLDSGAGRLLGHEDVDLFTLLPAPRSEGLQVLKRDGRWVRMRAPEGSIILNTGDYLQRISNDILPSTTHRVSPPRESSLAEQARVSFPLAAYLRPDEMLEVLPGLPNPKYDPISVIRFHTRTTAKFYGDDYAVDSSEDPPASST